MREWRVELLPYQQQFFDCKARFPAMVSAWGTGKTMVGLLKAMDLTIRYPGNLGLVVRQDFTDLRASTIKDFELYTGRTVPTNKDVIFSNGSTIMFRHGSELKKLQNINLGWFLIEQAEEFESEQEFNLLRGRLRRKGVPHQGIIIANTKGHNWIWRLWKSDKRPEYELFEATSFDNPHIPEDTREDWKRMAVESPSHYRRYIMNSWDDADLTDKVIAYSDLRSAVNRQLNFSLTVPPIVVSCDPAEFGDDQTVIYVLRGGAVIDQKVMSKKEPMETAGHIVSLFRRYKADAAIVDADGIGSGIRSRLNQLGVRVVGVKAGMKATRDDTYYNRKAEMWMQAQELFREELVSIPEDELLIEDLAAHTYCLDSRGRICIERKIDVKKRLGRSPDRADALVMGLWGQQRFKRRPKRVRQLGEELSPETADRYATRSVICG